jgi:hypothetical protein
MEQEQRNKEINIMARNGKIARLPQAVRSQLNSRLQDGNDGKHILKWLNSLPEVRKVLQETFDGHPVNDQNLSDWRQGGFQEWLACQDIAAQAAQLAANRDELQRLAPGQSPAELLAAALTFRCNALLAGQPAELDPSALAQLRALGHLCQAAVKVLREEHNAARLKMETERWELERERLRAENQEAEKRRLRAALGAKFWTMMKIGEWHNKLGGGPRAAIVAGILREIEMCQDPAHFHSEIIGNRTQEQWDRYVEEQIKKAPPQKTELEQAIETYHKMGAAVGEPDPRRKARKKARKKAASAHRRSKPHRRPRRQVRPRVRRPSAEPPHESAEDQPDAQVHEVHQVPEVPEVHPEEPPAPAEDAPSSLCPDTLHQSITPPLQPPPESGPIVSNQA